MPCFSNSRHEGHYGTVKRILVSSFFSRRWGSDTDGKSQARNTLYKSVTRLLRQVHALAWVWVVGKEAVDSDILSISANSLENQ